MNNYAGNRRIARHCAKEAGLAGKANIRSCTFMVGDESFFTEVIGVFTPEQKVGGDSYISPQMIVGNDYIVHVEERKFALVRCLKTEENGKHPVVAMVGDNETVRTMNLIVKKLWTIHELVPPELRGKNPVKTALATPASKEAISILAEKAKIYAGRVDEMHIQYGHGGVGDLCLYFKNGFAAPQTFTGTLYYSYVKAYTGLQPDKDWAKKQTEIY